MIKKLIKLMFGTRNQRLIKQYTRQVQRINAFSEAYAELSDQDLQAKTEEFRQRIKNNETLEQLLPEAFAVVREASWRTLQMRHFDVQLIGGMVLHYGKVAEMRTGEGKTLVATLPAYLNALSGKGVHVVTVNDYLAERDANWMRPVYEFLGLTVGINPVEADLSLKKAAYACDITYGTNNDFGFDYLRDNMAFSLEDQVQRKLHYAIIDEVDSILIDEARTPLIISGQTEESSDLYQQINTFIPKLTLQTKKEKTDSKLAALAKPAQEEDEEEGVEGDYTLDEKTRQAHLTEQGHEKVEQMLQDAGLLKEGTNLYDASNISLLHYFNAALRANTLYQRDVDYIVKDNEIVIVDEHTGRLMQGRRWSDGLHQAVEAKEGVKVETENQTMASITFQNFFRLYEKLSGMTGTADTEAFELQKIYGLEVMVVPTNKPTVRVDETDKIFLNMQGKYKAIADELRERHKQGQPILVGTASIESSELISKMLTQEKIKHEVLNAKNHEREAKIIAEAGRPGAITIATNMAGRGTDIVLGGNFEMELEEMQGQAKAANQPELTSEAIEALRAEHQKRSQQVLEAGGLHVLGTERNESRRVDNQLRGRSGRQGDPGSSQFYLSLEDNLLRIFASERMASMMRRLGIGQDDVIQNNMISRSIENAQRRVEGMNFDARKQLLEYDDVANDQRKVIYQQRQKLLASDDISQAISDLRPQVVDYLVELYMPAESVAEQWDVPALTARLQSDFNLQLDLQQVLDEDQACGPEEIKELILQHLEQVAQKQQEMADVAELRQAERNIMLQMLDQYWKEHLAAMDHLRKSIHLRGYAQKNPAQEYKRECFDMFTDLLDRIKYDVIATLTRLEVMPSPDQVPFAAAAQPAKVNMVYSHQELPTLSEQPPVFGDAGQATGGTDAPAEGVEADKLQPVVRTMPKVGRNDPCPCGSGKKYKQCHGKITS